MKLASKFLTLIEEKRDFFSLMNPEKELVGKPLKNITHMIDFGDASPVIDQLGKIVGFVYPDDDNYNGEPLSDLGQKEIKGVWVYVI